MGVAVELWAWLWNCGRGCGTVGVAVYRVEDRETVPRKLITMAVPMELSGCFWLCLFVAALQGPCLAIRVSTAGSLLVKNGTDAYLSCTFSSAGTISPAFSISWSFKPQNGGTAENLIHYAAGKTYPTKRGRFVGRVSLEGNVMRGDASLKLRNVEFADNGTYTCSVINPPNIDGNPGEVKLGVVLEVKWSEGKIVVTAVACLAGFVIVLVMITAIVMVCRKRKSQKSDELGNIDAEKDALKDQPTTDSNPVNGDAVLNV
uniref:myelin protein P0 isoform X2 n=1 Tax=Myxine glutinosa TaxID=7769 RepID=UPI00358F799B